MKNNVIDNTETLIESGADVTQSIISPISSWIRYKTVIRNSTVDCHVFIGFRGCFEWADIKHHSQIASKVLLRGKPDHRIIIGPYCWIGAGVVVEAGVTIGEGSVIGAGSYVTKDILPYCICAGKELRVLKERKCKKDQDPNFSWLLQHVRNNKINSLKTDFSYQVGKQCYITADILHGDNLTIGDGSILIGKRSKEQDGGLIFGDNVSIGKNLVIEGAGGIIVGKNVIIEDDVILLSTTHRYDLLSAPMIKTPLIVEDGVTIQRDSIVIGGIKLGFGSKVFPHSVVTKSVSSETQVGGVPAKLLQA